MFFAMNRITCRPEYRSRFEELFCSRAREVDKSPGFSWMKVLRPLDPEDPYIVLSCWKCRDDFDNWRRSEAFKLGHSRGFEDVAAAGKEGRPAPMVSDMELYEVFTE